MLALPRVFTNPQKQNIMKFESQFKGVGLLLETSVEGFVFGGVLVLGVTGD